MNTAGEVHLTTENIYQYTLYYYDNAGNLLKTITPKDFRRVNENLWGNVDLIRNGAPITPSLQPSFAPHMAATSYYYNSLNAVTAQYTPDADLSNFWYDTKGRLFASQNKEQHSPTTVDGVTLPADRYSYTQYDALGRIVVVGEQSGKTLTGVLNNSFVQESDITAFFNGGTKKSVTRTFYDTETGVAGHPWYNAGLQGNLHNLRKRVVASTYQETENSTIEQATYYSYDLMGNVKSVWQRLLGLPEFKRTDYQFELTSGKTTGVLYQDGKSDAFYHQYEYDAENRVKAVYTNTQKTTSAGLLSLINAPGTVKDANYQYYPHGPLSRTELGGNLQGLDYAYTLQGWLKTLNGQDLNASKDMGRDGESGTGLHAGFNRDVLAYTIGYFIGDYHPINGSSFIRPFSHNGVSGLRGVSQYNGNISHATYANKGLGDGTNIVGYLYAYRQLNVLAGRNFHTISSSLNSWHDNTGTTQKYRESYNTDVNGNIITIIRNGDNPNDGFKMDDLRLEYNGNKLDYVRELYTNSAAYENDLEHQAPGNYTYDKIGNLVKDVDAGLTGVYWNVYGKIAEIRKAGTVMKYRYDASGNRVYKETVASGVTNSTWYVRDAQGNVLTTYDASGGAPLVKESYIYGSSRLGLYRWIPGAAGKRSYEISNYLGNVMATIGEAQMHVGNGSLIDYYDADIETATDYYSYGMVMPDRESNVAGYRYGFNGKENDNEVKFTGNQQDYGMRIYDPRLGRFLSVDPITASYPMLTPYQFASNRPIDGIDLDGKEWAQESFTENVGTPSFAIVSQMYVKVKVSNVSSLVSDPNIVKAKAEVYKKAIEGKMNAEATVSLFGLPFKVKFKTEVILDYSPPSTDDDGAIGQLIFDDRFSKTTTSTSGSIINTNTESTPGDNQGRVNEFKTKIAITMDGVIVNDADIATTSVHEGGHSGGLNHPWNLNMLEKKLTPELNQEKALKPANVKRIKNNAMNSSENPNLKFMSNSGTELTIGQLNVIFNTVKKESYYTPVELKTGENTNN